MLPSDAAWIWGVRLAGGLHFVTLAAACMTPIPPRWEENLATLPETHRRFAIAQNIFIGATIGALGLLCLGFAPLLVAGAPLARAVCAGIALWWGGRLAVLPWLNARAHLTTPWLRTGFVLLQLECAAYALGFGWLALRG